MEDFLVTIRIPCFNESRFIEQTINSALLQNYSNIELIVCDNCSTDGTSEIIHKYALAGKLIHVRHKENIDALHNFICALNAAKRKILY